jgi:hypothetical protein
MLTANPRLGKLHALIQTYTKIRRSRDKTQHAGSQLLAARSAMPVEAIQEVVHAHMSTRLLFLFKFRLEFRQQYATIG